MQNQGMFKGFDVMTLLTMDPRVMCAILAEQLAKAGVAIETMNEEIKDLRNKINEQNKE